MKNAIASFGLPETANKKTHPIPRQSGKAQELGCGFGMGGPKFQAALAKAPYFIKVSLEEAKRLVDIYRATHPMVRQFWRDIEHAALSAVAEPGSVHSCGVGATIRFTKRGGYLFCVLPSGRVLTYPRPRIIERPVPWDHKQTRPAVSVEGVDSMTKQWMEYDLYGGILTENVVQAMARDRMVYGMFRVEERGYPIILTVHDEIVTDVPEEHGSVKEFLSLLETAPPWASRCPITAEGWEGPRYGK
jgi:DNA polymerase